MERILITNSHIYTPGEDWQPGWLLTQGKTIVAMGHGPEPDFSPDYVARIINAHNQVVLPGFIDLHVHGGAGFDTMDATPRAFQEMAQFYARHGVTAFLATTRTASHQAILRAIQGIHQSLGPIQKGAALLGAHLEGPYLNPERCGAQNTAHIRRAQPAEALEFLDSGVVKLVALAPEFPENLWLLDECVRRGIRVSAGHTAASYEEMAAAVRRGLSQVTHCFNAMTGLGHRLPGTVGAALSLSEISCELIADNIHVHPAVQKILVEVKGMGHVILVTDAGRGAGLPDGEYKIDERSILVKDGAVRLVDGTLAGSTLTLDRALGNICSATGRSLGEAWPLASLNAARAIGVAHSKGSLEVGKDADLVILDSKYQVMLSMVEGAVAWEMDN
jgi:N-acetylglucosamine-6-phosphate deacetylase